MIRAVVNVAWGNYRAGQERLANALRTCIGGAPASLFTIEPEPSWPRHEDKPYAFKAYALKEAAEHASVLLWLDASVLPVQSLESLWARIEDTGALVFNNGYPNSQWCADSWYGECFPGIPLEHARAINRNIRHVVGGAFGLSLKHPVGAKMFADYCAMAETNAFRGPWRNTPETPCGPPEVSGHRHDQSCLSLIAYSNEVELVDPPVLAYYRAGEPVDKRTILLVKGI
jgi:hypothetical protein